MENSEVTQLNVLLVEIHDILGASRYTPKLGDTGLYVEAKGDSQRYFCIYDSRTSKENKSLSKVMSEMTPHLLAKKNQDPIIQSREHEGRTLEGNLETGTHLCEDRLVTIRPAQGAEYNALILQVASYLDKERHKNQEERTNI